MKLVDDLRARPICFLQLVKSGSLHGTRQFPWPNHGRMQQMTSRRGDKTTSFDTRWLQLHSETLFTSPPRLIKETKRRALHETKGVNYSFFVLRHGREWEQNKFSVPLDGAEQVIQRSAYLPLTSAHPRWSNSPFSCLLLPFLSVRKY